MDILDLNAAQRTETGKGPARRLRMEGLLPAVLYGTGIEENILLSLNDRELEKVLHTGAGGNVLVNLKIQGKRKQHTVMFKDVSRNPSKENIVHVDLFEISMDQKVTVEVPVHLEGKCRGVVEGGIIQHELRTVRVECLPNAIPASVDVDVTDLDTGDSVHISDLRLPEGVNTLDDETLTVVSIVAPAAEEEVKTAEEIEAELSESFEEKEEEEKE